ncbi:MAG: sulfide/dihydroorotate dehydrogenase-like FAD/NAD-binding protein [Candidatus Odinarchaeia archaeon]
MFKIIRKEKITPSVNLFEIEAEKIARHAKPGQFIMVRVCEDGERIPLTIADKDPEKGTITMVVQEVGKTTIQMGQLNPGDFLLDVLGPLGKPTEIKNFGTVVLVAGGVGIAEIYLIADAMKKAGNHVISILGFRSKDFIFWDSKIKEVSHETIITTNDGSAGMKGFTTHALQKLIDDGVKIDLVHAVGPIIMMKFIAELTKPYGIKTLVSLNPIMVDGTGMCGGCRVTVGGEVKFACVDGPEFDGHKVDFDEIIQRLEYYKDLEKISLEKWMREKGMV